MLSFALAAVLAAALCALARADTALPQYHFVPLPHNWMNDPNGPFYDPVHGLYHLMYQYLTPRVWGHAVSRDLIHWIQLPIALNTDMWYDQGGVFSGSATILDDEARTPMLSYSVSTNDMQCIAYPTNRSDPYLVQWTKFPGNPIITTKKGAPPGRDDTTAWLGGVNGSVWRMAYGTDQGAIIFTSPDFRTWTEAHLLNSDDPTGMWECPDFYPVPGGDGVHVLKASTLGRDFWTTGTYFDANISFVHASKDMGAPDQLYDYGRFYASKSFYDPVKDRQVLWGWILEERDADAHGAPYGWASVQSLPRSITLADDGVSINTYPVDEVAQLRDQSSYFIVPQVKVPAGSVYPLKITGAQLELHATLAGGSSCGFQVLWSAGGEYTRMGVGNNSLTGYMPGTDLLGGDYNITNVNYQDPHICQAACISDPRCQAWTYVVRPPLYASCCLKGTVPAANPSAACTSGVRNPVAGDLSLVGNLTHSSLNTTDHHAADTNSGPLPAGVSSADLALFVDHSMLELFSSGKALTRRAYPTLADAVGVGLYAGSTDCTFSNVYGWTLDSAPVQPNP